jgi:dihydroorotase
MKQIIEGGRVIDPASGVDKIANVYIENERIVGVGQELSGFVADQTHAANGLWVVPGLVDLSARLREPGFEFKSALESELQAAVAGGVTSLACPPDTDPTLDEPGLVKMLKFRTQSLNLARVYPLGALTLGLKGDVLTEMAELTEAGCVGFTQVNEPMFDTQVILRAMQYAKSFGFSIWLQPTDPYLGRGGVAHSGAVASRLGLSGISVSAEVIAIQTLLELVRSTQCQLHLCRLSSAAGIDLVRKAKIEGLPVTADVSIYHTLLTDVDIGYFDTNYRVTPPLRAQRDRDGIWAGLADGTIDAICSDHTPVDDDAKLLPFADAEPGLTGLELLLPLALKLSVQSKLPFEKILSCISHRPGEIIANVAIKKAMSSQDSSIAKPDLALVAGSLNVGHYADLVLFDPEAHWTPSPGRLKSQGKHTPFGKQELLGVVKKVLVGGRQVFAL